MAERRRQPKRVALHECSEVPAHPVEPREVRQIVRRKYAVRLFQQVAVERLKQRSVHRPAGSARQAPLVPRHTERPEADIELAEGLRIERRCRLLHIVPEVFKQLRRVPHCRHAIGMQGRAGDRPVGEGDPQPAGIGADVLGEWALRRRAGIGVSRHAALGCVQKRGIVLHRDRDGVLVRDAAHGLPDIRPHGDPGPRRLQAENAAAGRRDTDRPCAVRRMRNGHGARGNENRRPAAGPAAAVLRVPGVPARPEQQRLGRPERAELRRVGLAIGDHPGSAVAAHQLAVARRRHIRHRPAAAGRRHPGIAYGEVLQRKRHTGERAFRQSGRDLGAGFVIQGARHGVEARMDGLGARNRPLQRLARR